MQGDQAAMDRFAGSIAGTVPLPQFLHPFNIGSIMLRGLARRLRGSPSPSLATGGARTAQ
jgi:hypothetical protein